MTVQVLHKIRAVQELIGVFRIMGDRPSVVVEVEALDRFGRHRPGIDIIHDITDKAIEEVLENGRGREVLR